MRFNRQSKEEDYLAKCLHDTIVQNQQNSLQFALDNFYDLKIKLPRLHLSQYWVTWYPSCNTLQILIIQLKLFDKLSLKIQSTQTIQSDLTVSAVSYQYQVPLQFNHLTDLRQIESLIDDILNFDSLGGNIIVEIDPTSTRKVFALMIQ